MTGEELFNRVRGEFDGLGPVSRERLWKAGNPGGTCEGWNALAAEVSRRAAEAVEVGEVTALEREIIALREDLEAQAAKVAKLREALDGMVDAYWRGSEDSDDDHAPDCVKVSLSLLTETEPTP